MNADTSETLTVDYENMNQCNLFAYCFNNPVNMSDDTGTWPSWATKYVAAVAVVAVVVAVAAITVATAGTGTFVAAVAVGAAKGAAIGMVSGAALGAATGAIEHKTSTGSWSGAGQAALEYSADGALSGAVTGAVVGGITSGVGYAKSSGLKVQEIGKLKPANKPGDGNFGIKYSINKANGKPTMRSFELHPPHKSGPHQRWHWQQNTWNPRTDGITSNSRHWTLFGRRF